MKHSCSTGSTSRRHHTPRESPGTELTEDTEKTTRVKAVDPDVEKLSPPILQLSEVICTSCAEHNITRTDPIQTSRKEEYRHQLGSFRISGDLVLRLIVLLSGGQKSRLACALIVMHCSYSGSGSLCKGLCQNRLPLFQCPNGLWANQISRHWVPTWLSVQMPVDSFSHLIAIQSVWEV